MESWTGKLEGLSIADKIGEKNITQSSIGCYGKDTQMKIALGKYMITLKGLLTS